MLVDALFFAGGVAVGHFFPKLYTYASTWVKSKLS